FVQDAYGYVTVNGVLWLIWALTDRSSGGSMPWPAWVSAVWGFFLAMDAWKAFGPWPRSLHRPITEADIEREIRRSRPG
ncbi:MAG: 2TM domain-containing protein, partial [Gaiellaceae bacterium]